MLAGTFALVERSLRVDARSRSTHLIRLGLMAAIYFGLCQTLLTGFAFGAPGLRFFSWIASLDMIFLTLLGVSFFSSVITEEKEEDTLGLMMMAGISPLGILLGKSVGGLWQAILVIAVQYPFSLLAVTMGGVTHGQVWAMTVALIAYTIFLAGLGLFCSTISPHSRSASFRAALGVFLYFFLAGIAEWLYSDHIRRVVQGGGGEETTELLSLPEYGWTLLSGIANTTIYHQMSFILSTGGQPSTVTIQFISNIAMGGIAVGFAWLLFGVSTRNPSSEMATRGLVARRRGFFRFSAGRTWGNPFLWKDFHFVSGGLGMTIVRCAFFITLGLIPCLGPVLFGAGGDEIWIVLSIYLLVLSSSIGAARLLARSMHDEIRGQTLPSLMMLPRSTAGIVYSKYAGALLGWLPGAVFGPLALFTSDTVRKGVIDLLDSPFFWTITAYNFMLFTLVVLIGFLFFWLTPHLAAYLALYMRWGAVPFAVGLAYCVLMIMVAVGGILSFLLGRTIDEVAGMVLMAVGLFCLCVACHISILLRVQALAAK